MRPRRWNRIVAAVLRSPARRLLSGSVALVRYTGRRTGQQVVTPVQFVRRGLGIVILAGHHERKAWWRNFTDPHDVDVLLDGRWVEMRGCVVAGSDDVDRTATLLDVYLRRFPKAVRALGPGARAEQARRTVLVACAPRPHLTLVPGAAATRLDGEHLDQVRARR